MRTATLLLFVSIILFSCSTHRKVVDTLVVTDTTSVRIDTVTTTRLVPYVTPEDSALIQLGLRCDSNGHVLIDNYQYEHTRALNLEYSLDSLNHILFKARQIPDTILIPVQDTTVKKTIEHLRNQLAQKQTTITEYVDKPLSWFNKLFLELGKITSALVVVSGIVLAGRFVIRNKLIKI